LGIIKVHTKRVPLAQDVELDLIARGTPGMTGADLENLVNEAALLAARRNKEKVDMNDFELAKDKVMMGAERRSMVMSLAERRNTAYHEAGHALVAMLQPGADPVHKVTIIPRGMALGVTQQLPLDDRYTYSRDYLMTQLATMFGGRVAEELVFGQMTTGAGDDIEKATELARKMVCQWGMSQELGPMTFGRREEQVFLGRDIAHHKDYSEHTAIEIDREVRRIVDQAFQRARKLLSDNIPLLHAVSERLLEKEVLDGSEVAEMVKAYTEGRPFPADRPAESGGGAKPGAAPATEKPKPAGEEAPAIPGLPPKPVLA
jgi:cell division protease FtsH